MTTIMKTTIGLRPEWDEDRGRNVATRTENLRVMLDPDLERPGEQDWVDGYGHVITLREWDLQVLVHELCHAFLPGGEFEHPLIAQIEVALTPLVHQLARLDAEHTEPDESEVEAARAIVDRLTCTQCGNRFEDRACGISHALIASDPLQHRLVAALRSARGARA